MASQGINQDKLNENFELFRVFVEKEKRPDVNSKRWVNHNIIDLTVAWRQMKEAIGDNKTIKQILDSLDLYEFDSIKQFVTDMEPYIY